VQKNADDIEIISEHFPVTGTLVSKMVVAKNLMSSNAVTDDSFRLYLAQKFNMDLMVSAKPQSNFVSNAECIEHIMKKANYDEIKRPYIQVKKNPFMSYTKKEQTAASDEEEEGEYSADNGTGEPKMKKQKVIVIDDLNGDETHKPWITPALIKLIKQRNLLQSKLNVEGKEPDPELVKKFKNLRNKVTKLVKNARKEYLAKYIKDKKEGEVTTNGESSAPATTIDAGAATSKPTATISATQSNYMMNLYNSFFNQYMQQYTQHKTSATAASTDGGYDSLTQQAAFYAQQQHSIQQQLETCLSNTTQQFLGELAASSSMPSVAPAGGAAQAAPYAMPYHYKMTS